MNECLPDMKGMQFFMMSAAVTGGPPRWSVTTFILFFIAPGLGSVQGLGLRASFLDTDGSCLAEGPLGSHLSCSWGILA